MNASLTSAEVEALLDVLHRGIIQIRLATYGGDIARAEAIADALHNIPRLISEGDRCSDLAAIVQPLCDLATDA